MRQTKATDYALHTVAYMIEHSTDENISVHVLAKQFDVFTNLSVKNFDPTF